MFALKFELLIFNDVLEPWPIFYNIKQSLTNYLQKKQYQFNVCSTEKLNKILDIIEWIYGFYFLNCVEIHN